MEQQIVTFGDVRRLILETIIALKGGGMDISRGMAIAANMKVLNDSIQVEINAAKMSLLASQTGKDFGDIVKLGRRKALDGIQLIDAEEA